MTLDDKPELFSPRACPDVALYCGWYSLANFVELRVRARRGGVAPGQFRGDDAARPEREVVVPEPAQGGAAATLGPVAEPYTVGFPKPAEFFGFLATGEYTLVECYARTVLL